MATSFPVDADMARIRRSLYLQFAPVLHLANLQPYFAVSQAIKCHAPHDRNSF